MKGDSITTTIKSTVTNPDGTSTIKSDRYYYGKDKDGNYGFIGSDGSLYSRDDKFVNSLSKALGTLKSASRGNSLVSGLMNSTNNVEIAQGKNGADSKGTFIRWDPNSTMGGPDQTGSTTRPTYIGLGHEMAHIEDAWNGTYDASKWTTVGQSTIQNAEKYATHVENQLRSEHGLSLRTHYSPGYNSTRILHPKTNQSLFYKRIVTLGGVNVPTTPYMY